MLATDYFIAGTATCGDTPVTDQGEVDLDPVPAIMRWIARVQEWPR